MNFIDLFAGAGGLSEGFIRAGFTPIAHIESDKSACFTLKTRSAYHYLKDTENFSLYNSYLKEEISREELYEHIPDGDLNTVINEEIGQTTVSSLISRVERLAGGRNTDVIIGGPPCQAYSVVGRSRDSRKMKGDPRNYLYKYYAQFLRHFSPKLFLFENVKGLLSAGNGVFLENIKKIIHKSGYCVKVLKLNAKDFGVLQNRERLLIIGWRNDLTLDSPDFERNECEEYKVIDLLKDLPFLKPGEEYAGDYQLPPSDVLARAEIRNNCSVITQHIARNHRKQDLDIYRIAIEKWNDSKIRLKYDDLPKHLISHKNTSSFLDRFKVVAGDMEYSHTVVAHIARDGHYYIHPDINQCRSLTIREAARIQSFPDNYYFEGAIRKKNRAPAYRQIGNAVPPLMAYKIAQRISTLLN